MTRKISFKTAINEALDLEMTRDPSVILLGEDIVGGSGAPGEDDDWDFGTGAGFYLDAEAEPWKRNYRLYSYVTKELPALIEANFPVEAGRRGVFGHSMGGHGALVAALRNPQAYRSISAFAPICNPVAVPWGEKAFGSYLGADRGRWSAWDASELLKQGSRFPGPILIDQGMKDQFFAAQLRPDALEAAAEGAGQELVLRRHEGYDHSYWFIQTFIEDHLNWHADRLHA